MPVPHGPEDLRTTHEAFDPTPCARAPKPERRRRRRALLGTALALAALTLGFARWGAAGVEQRGDAPLPTRGLAGLHRVLGLAPRVGLQVGHWRADAHPEELARLRWSTGGHAAGVDEVDVNAAVARALRERLRAAGVRVDLLTATVPPGYRADLLVSLHADASGDPGRRGYKSAHFHPPRSPREPVLKRALDEAYLAASGLPTDEHNVSGNMLHYYAFNHRRYRHAAHPETPALIVELGYLSHPVDRGYLTEASGPAEALARGILTYLRETGRW